MSHTAGLLLRIGNGYPNLGVHFRLWTFLIFHLVVGFIGFQLIMAYFNFIKPDNQLLGIALFVALCFSLKVFSSAAKHIDITQLLPGTSAAESTLVGGAEELTAMAGELATVPGAQVTATGALEATGEIEMVTDSFMQKLSPEARAQLEARDRMTEEVTGFTEENPEGAAQLLRIWTSGIKG